MKNILGLLCCFTLIITAQAQTDYNKQWSAVERLELDDKIEDAALIVNDIFKKASRKKDEDQMIKAFLYQSKFKLVNKEDAQYKIITLLDELIASSTFPSTNIYHSIKARLIFNYLEQHRWQINNRTPLQSKSTDFKTWDSKRFYTEIHSSFQASLKNADQLIEIPVGDYGALLYTMAPARILRPSLLDLLTHEALAFYKTDYLNLTKPKEEFKLTEKNAFLETDKILQLNRPAGDTIFSKYDVLQQYARLEQLHLKENNIEAYLYVLTERLAYGKDRINDKQPIEKYENQLKNLIAQYDKKPAVTMAYNKLAAYYYQLSTTLPKGERETYRNQAITTAQRAVSKYPKSYGAILCETLLEKIFKPNLRLVTENYIIPNTAHRGVASYTNLDQLQLYYVKIPHDYALAQPAFTDSIATAFLNKARKEQSIIHSKSITLPQSDTYSHSYEYVIPALDKGHYVIIGKTITKKGEPVYSRSTITVTNITIDKKIDGDGLQLLVKNRTTGKPEKNAVVKITSKKRSRNYTTDVNGLVRFSSNDDYRRKELILSKKNDTLATTFYYGRYYRNYIEEGEEKLNVKSFIYLDRAIYRPGQTVYFKSILLKKYKEQSSVIPNQLLKVYAEDVNGTEIYRTQLTTNEYGSINGSFTIPDDVLTGEFDLYVDQPDEESAYDKSNYEAPIEDWDEGYLTFKVEEYKRPRFKASFNKVTETYKLGDSITITGKAKALLGSSITNAQVTYKVLRSVNYNSWTRYYNTPAVKVISQDTTTTDDKGSFKIKFLSEREKDINTDFNPVYNYSLEASVTDINGETRTASTTIKVSDKPIKIITNVASNWTVKNNSFKVGVQNLNNQYVNARLVVELRKKQQPTTIIRKTILPQADYHELNTKNYRKLFPYAALREDEKEQDWKDNPILFRKELTTDSLTTVKLPITDQWDNGSYYLYVKAVEADQEFSNETTIDNRSEHKVWAQLNKSLEPSLITVNTDLTDKTALFNLFTSTDGVYANITLWSDKKLLDEKVLFLNKGKTALTYLWENIDGKQVSLKVDVLKENMRRSSNTRTIVKPVAPVQQFTIATSSFRNKLEPGVNETWSFTIKDQDKLPMQAEVLASMYDKSLDEFTTASWDSPYFYNRDYNYNPKLFMALSERRASNSTFYFPQINFNPLLKMEKINFYGLSFYDNYRSKQSYRQYLNYKTQEPKTYKGFITGKITDEYGNPLYGANVKNTSNNIIVKVGINGLYKIKADKRDRLEVSHEFYKSTIQKVRREKIINFYLDHDLDKSAYYVNNDVFFIPSINRYRNEFSDFNYYRGNRYTKNKIGADGMIAVVSDEVKMESDGYNLADQFNNSGLIKVSRMNSSSIQTLQGQVPGLEITTTPFQPGPASSISIRGSNTDSPPLFIVDGVSVSEDVFRAMNTNSFSSVSILKNTNATSLYGSRGAGGVIVISTNKDVSANDLIANMMSLNNVKARKNLQETAFFLPDLKTDKKGNLKFSFTTPEALTQWKLRLLAHDRKGASAQLEKLVVTQKELSIVPNAPRFLRELDTIQLSAKIANLSLEKMNGLARLELYDATTMQPVDKQFNNVENLRDYSIVSKGNTAVSWRLVVPKDLAAVTYRIVASAGDYSDGEENTLPILTNRMLVKESRVLWVRSDSSQTVTIDNLANNTSTTLDHNQLVFEYTSNPSWYAIKSLPYLMEYQHDCAEQTFSKYYANTVAQHILTSNPKIKEVFNSWSKNGTNVSKLEQNEKLKNILLTHTPWLRDAQSETEKQQRLATLFDLTRIALQKKKNLARLERMQDYDGGFPWFKGGRMNPYITRHIAAGIGHLDKLGIKNENTIQTDRIYNNAIKALDADWKKRFNKHLESNKSLDNYSYGTSYWHYQYARSFKAAATSKQDQVLVDGWNYAFAKAESQHTAQSLYTKLLIALTAYRKGEKSLAKTVLEGLKQTTVKSPENGMYWKENENGYRWHSSDIETQALAIEAFKEINNDLTTVEELSIWLLKNKRTNQWKSTKATAAATYALLIQDGKWIDVKENNTIIWGNAPIPQEKLDAVKKEAGTGYFKISLPASEVTPALATVTVKNKSKVTGYGALYWQYFEDLDKIKSDTDQPLSIKKELYKKVMTDNGMQLVPLKPEQPIAVGDLITSRLIIKASATMDFIHLKDMRASGFEPVDVLSEYKYKDGLSYYLSTKDVATHFFFDQVKKGTYVLEYDVRANNAGYFSNGISQLESMYTPDFSSHSAGLRVNIIK